MRDIGGFPVARHTVFKLSQNLAIVPSTDLNAAPSVPADGGLGFDGRRYPDADFRDREWESLMPKAKLDGHAGLDSSAAHATAEPAEAIEHTQEVQPEDHGDVVATVTTVAVVGLGAAFFEAALLPGIVLGVAAMWVPQYLPKMGAALNPLFRSTVRGAYKIGHKTREMVAEAQEQMHDIVAEVHSEGDLDPASARGPLAPANGSPN
jgi:Protein of unknown function (DUF5132)